GTGDRVLRDDLDGVFHLLLVLHRTVEVDDHRHADTDHVPRDGEAGVQGKVLFLLDVDGGEHGDDLGLLPTRVLRRGVHGDLGPRLQIPVADPDTAVLVDTASGRGLVPFLRPVLARTVEGPLLHTDVGDGSL